MAWPARHMSVLSVSVAERTRISVGSSSTLGLSTGSFLPSTEHKDNNNGIPSNKLGLSSDDISRCLLGSLSLNLTVEDETTITYVQKQESQMIPNKATNAATWIYEETSSQFPREVPGGRRLDSSRGQQVDESLEARGACSVIIEAPPGKVLSILFLNQTCSPDKEVRVRDFHDGWGTALDGCSPWKSPGYDVTTAHRSALLVIDSRNATDFFRLNVQIKAVVITDGAFTRYVSPVLGYIQTPGWHPFARPFTGVTEGTAAVKVPLHHVTLISVIYNFCIFIRNKFFRYDVPLTLFTVKAGSKSRPQVEWKMEKERTVYPKEVLRYGLAEFRVKFREVYGYYFHGVRMLFSFHEPLTPPRPLPGGLWNCTLPSWPDFYQHFVCNGKTECGGLEDEMWCPDTSCQRGGMLINGICYFSVRLKRWALKWVLANNMCKLHGGTLASFPTVKSWYHLALLTQQGLPRHSMFCIGLRSPKARYPHMYRYSYQWSSGSIAHYVNFNLRAGNPNFPPTCVYMIRNILYPRQCMLRIPLSHALCQKTSFPASTLPQRSQKRPGERKSSHRPTKPIASPPGNTSWDFPPVRTIVCPDHHRTLDFLANDAFSACWHEFKAASSDVRCTKDNSKTLIPLDVDEALLKAMFPCQNGQSSVSYSLVCNHLQDCVDNSDEEFCVFAPCSGASQYRCANGQCLQFRHYCDEFVQCVDESDEADCRSKTLILYRNKEFLAPRPPAVGDFDGRGWITYTRLTPRKAESAVVCPDTHVLCPGDGYCLPVYVRCNGLIDCPGHEDEVACDSYTCPGLYRCRGVLHTCLHPNHLCDGRPQCPQHDDETFCDLTCPVNCTCLGHAFTCSSDFRVESFSSLRYLDAGGTGLEPERLANNSLLIYLSLASCDLTHLGNVTLPNLLTLDLSDNRLKDATVAELNLMKNLRRVHFARNPLIHLFSRNSSADVVVHEGILHVDLTGINIDVLDVDRNLPFPRLQGINLSQSGVTSLTGDGFRTLKYLHTLDLRGCPMNLFPRRLFGGLKDLRLVFADNFKLCCEANLPDGFDVGNCHAPFDEVSSCGALLGDDVYRVCLSVLATLTLCGNLGCFCLRLFSLAVRSKTGFSVFVIHLSVSDFVMGVYMAMIGVADRLYLGKYLWEDGSWRKSAACQVAGVSALLSSEVSALIICLITLDRFLVIRFPFSRLRFSSFSAQIVSFLAWIGCVVLVIVPILPVTPYRTFYGQTGICVPLPITRNDFPGHQYAFGVMILLNLVIFVVVATGQISVYMSMMSNAMSSIDMNGKSRDLIVARRLISVVVSDFLCWFPLGLLGVLASQGVPIPGEVNVAMAIFVLPLNSALNPFLYTLNIIQEKRQRATEMKLLKIITDEKFNRE